MCARVLTSPTEVDDAACVACADWLADALVVTSRRLRRGTLVAPLSPNQNCPACPARAWYPIGSMITG